MLVAPRGRNRLTSTGLAFAVIGIVVAVGVSCGKSRQASSRLPSKIAFESDRDGDLEIDTMNADGSGVMQLTKNRARDVVPAWSPNGRKIAFTSSRDGNREIYVMNADGGDQRRLTHNPARDLFPTWSPDGGKIAFVRESRRGTFAGPIYVVNADGSGERKLAETRGADCCLAWSPDGEQIAYVSDSLEISLLTLANGETTRLTKNKAGDCCPAWSPTGKTIAFASDRRGGGKFKIYLMNADGTAQRRISSLLSIRPAFAPDGRRLAFTGLPRTARLTSKSTEIYVMNVDGSGQRRLTRNAVEDAFPSWRP